MQNFADSVINIIDVKSQLEHQIQNQETKVSGLMLDKNISLKKGFF